MLCGVDQLRISSEASKMVPDIQEECPVKPEEEVKLEEEEDDDEIAKSRLERLKSLFQLPGGGIFAILLQDVMKSVLEESKVRISEEMVRFRKSMAEQLRNSSEHGSEDEVDLLKLNGSFRAAWNKWLGTPNGRKAEEAFKVFESCLFTPETDEAEMDEQAEAER